jgi:hypothetical protein
MSSNDNSPGYGGFYVVAGLAAVGLLVAVGISTQTSVDDVPPVAVSPSVTTMRTAGQAGTVTYPDCRDTAERPCVEYAEDFSTLVTESGARLPAVTVSRDTVSRPRTITIR